MAVACRSPLHAIIVPFPAQGHITPMLQLALKLLRGDSPFTHITFINTHFNHDLIAANGSSKDLFAVPGLRLLSVPDGLPPDHGRINDSRIVEFADAINVSLKDRVDGLVRDLVPHAASSLSDPPIRCLIGDILLQWMPDVARAAGLPYAAFWTNPTHAGLVYSSMSDLLAQGILPVKSASSESTQRLVDCIPGVVPLKACFLPSFLQSPDGSPEAFFFQWVLKRYGAGVPQKATWHIANTAHDLDPKSTAAFQKCMGKDFWPVGPLLQPEFFSDQMHTAPATGSSIWAESTGCKEWLDKQEDGSVLYISFGSIVHFESRQVQELAAGLEASGRRFLWALRMETDAATAAELGGFKDRTRHRGLVVSWAPQLLVLSHKSVGAFMTHCGWNSLLEGICGGIPILAWPGGFAEQDMNAKYVIDVWKNGVGFQKELTEEGMLLVKKEELERKILQVLDRCSEGSRALKEKALHLRKQMREAILSAEGSSQINLNNFVKAIAQHWSLP